MQIQHLLRVNSEFSTPQISNPKDFENPLRENNVLVDAIILDIRYTLLSNILAILIDLRTGSSIRAELGNTAILLFKNIIKVQMLELDTEGHKVFMVGESLISSERFVDVKLFGLLHGSIEITSKEASILIGIVDNIGLVASDASNEEAFLNTIPHWQSEIAITAFANS